MRKLIKTIYHFYFFSSLVFKDSRTCDKADNEEK